MVVPAVAQGVLPGPEAAAKAAAGAPNKKRQQAEAAITQAVADALHLISLIRQVVVLLSGGLLAFILANMRRTFGSPAAVQVCLSQHLQWRFLECPPPPPPRPQEGIICARQPEPCCGLM